MRKIVFFLIILFTGELNASDFIGVQELIKRRIPWLYDHVELKKTNSKEKGVDFFTLLTDRNKLIIEANNPNSAAVGVNWYLKYYCHRSMSHLGDNLAPVDNLPKINNPLTIRTTAKIRFALNYCTYNYSMSFYSWNDWERELDWMALNGVNLMLVANGSEAVWQRTLRRLNYTEKEISDFITGPAYNAWWLMGNIEGWGGPMPQSQIDMRMRIVQKMLKRMKSLGIEPLMPGFYGMVPSSMKNKSKAHIINQGNWGAFVRPDILDPTDPEFDKVAAIFYDETKNLYGSDIHYFSGDPFHEGGITDNISLDKAGKRIQEVMHKHFPKSIWVLQGWQDNPKKDLLKLLDKEYVLVQELFGENTNNWETRNGYEGTPFIWSTVTNFGERPGINGKLQRFADEVYRASNGTFSSLMKGVGIIPEGIHNNPVTYEFLLELVWHSEKIDVNRWIDNYITARYGKLTNEVRAAWHMMLKSIYSSEIGYQEGPPENILCARPGLNLKSVSSWGRLAKNYDLELYREAVTLLSKSLYEYDNVRTFKIDLINFLRQLIANEADSVYVDIINSYGKRNANCFHKSTSSFLDMIDTENELLAHDSFFRLSSWQKQAINYGNNPKEKKLNLQNLMMLITYWGENVVTEDNLHDYAYKEWSGLMETFYKERWKIYFSYLEKQMKGENIDTPDYFWWERKWVDRNLKLVNDDPKVSFTEIVEKIISQWGSKVPKHNWIELSDTKHVDETKWETCRPYNTAWGSTNVHYSRNNVPQNEIMKSRTLNLKAWKGERVNALALLWTTKNCENVSVRLSNLKGKNGNIIPSAAIKTSFLRYVMSDGLSHDGTTGCGHRPDHSEFDSIMVADIIDINTHINVQAKSTRPIWVGIQIPHDIPTGKYSGTLVFNGGKFAPLKIEVDVSENILPNAHDWTFHLDLWQNPYSVARYHGVPLWSRSHFSAMRSVYLPLANAGQKCITASILHHPWGGQTEDPFESMISRIRKPDGSWIFNYDVFDRWIEFMMSLGIDGAINCYSLIPWKLSFRYYDQASDSMKYIVADVGTQSYNEFWLPFLKDFARHLKERGWFSITSIAMDERPMEQMQKAIKLIHEADPKFKVSLAGNYHEEIESSIYDYSIASGQLFPPNILKRRQSSGMKSTFYTCCTEARPNMFIFSPPAESAWLAWYTAAEGFDGYLRWAFNSWVKNPLLDGRFRTWAAGDCFLFYPDGRS